MSDSESHSGPEPYRDIVSMVEQVYEFSSRGGCLHIALEDGNLEDEHIQYCLDSCLEHWSVKEMAGESGEQYVDLVRRLGTRLLELDEDLRCDLYDSHWKRTH